MYMYIHVYVTFLYNILYIVHTHTLHLSLSCTDENEVDVFTDLPGLSEEVVHSHTQVVASLVPVQLAL